MTKFELAGIITACVFALLGFSESGVVAFVGTILFAIVSAFVFIIQNEFKRKNYARARKSIIRKMAGI